MPHPQDPAPGLPDHGEGLMEEIVQRSSRFQPPPEFSGLVTELIVGEGLQGGFQGLDGHDSRRELAEFPVVLAADDLPEYRVEKHLAPSETRKIYQRLAERQTARPRTAANKKGRKVTFRPSALPMDVRGDFKSS
jgi:hypothetical protein